MPAADGESNHVTLAVVQNELRHVREDIAEVQKSIGEIMRDQKYQTDHQVQVSNDHLSRIASTEKSIASLTILVETIAKQWDRLGKIVEENSQHRNAMVERWAAHKEEHTREVNLQRVFSGTVSTIASTIGTIVATLANRPTP